MFLLTLSGAAALPANAEPDGRYIGDFQLSDLPKEAAAAGPAYGATIVNAPSGHWSGDIELSAIARGGAASDVGAAPENMGALDKPASEATKGGGAPIVASGPPATDQTLPGSWVARAVDIPVNLPVARAHSVSTKTAAGDAGPNPVGRLAPPNMLLSAAPLNGANQARGGPAVGGLFFEPSAGLYLSRFRVASDAAKSGPLSFVDLRGELGGLVEVIGTDFLSGSFEFEPYDTGS